MTRHHSAGFSLLEVMIALTMFAVFAGTFLVGQGYMVSDAVLNEDQLKLQMMADKLINDTVINPPRYTNALENLKETKNFEDTELSDYNYTVEWKKLKVPDFAKLFASQGSEREGGGESVSNDDYYSDENKSQRNQSVEQMVFTKLKENVEKAMWQVRITVTHKPSKYSLSLSRWITNYDEPIRLDLNF